MKKSEADQRNLVRTLWVGVGVIILAPTLFLIYVSHNQGLPGVQQWLVPTSGFVSLISVAIASWLAVNNYRLSIQAEKRLNDSSMIESNINLLAQFSKMMNIANARYDPILSEKFVEGLFQNKLVSESDFNDQASFQKLSEKLKAAMFQPSCGLAAQKAAIGAVYTLGKKHYILHDAAIEGLEGVKDDFIKSNKDYQFIDNFISDLRSTKKSDSIL